MTEGGGLKLQNTDRSKKIKEYSTELKKQMTINSIKKMAEREKEV